MRFWQIFPVFFLFLSVHAEVSKREVPISLKTSVIVPCHIKHLKFLPRVLEALKNQTTPPDEVVISLNPTRSSHHRTIQQMKRVNYGYHLVILSQTSTLSSGANRNFASQKASGQLIICQDADDLPHPQRIEIIKYFFQNYHVDIIKTKCTNHPRNFERYLHPLDVDWFSAETFRKGLGANGPIAISRRVISKVHWRGGFMMGEDVDFAKRAMKKFPNMISIQTPLYYYSNHR